MKPQGPTDPPAEGRTDPPNRSIDKSPGDSSSARPPAESIDELIAVINRGLIGNDPDRDPPGKGLEPAPREEAQLIRFLLDDILLAVPLSNALEIGRRPAVTALPNLPGWVLGVGNIRGEIVSMVDLKAFFGITSAGSSGNQRFIVLRSSEMKVGLVVDRILGIFTPDRAETSARDSLYLHGDAETMAWTAYVSKTLPLKDGTVLNILDTEKMLSSSRMNAFGSN